MPNLLAFEPAQFLGFVVILARVSGLIVAAPVLGDQTVPAPVKAGFAFLLSLVFFPVVAAPSLGANPEPITTAILLLREFGVGAMIGFVARLMFAGITLAGEVIGFQMGLGIANVFDPTSQEQVSLIGQFKSILALLLFVALDGHHLLIRAVIMSYRAIGTGAFTVTESLVQHLMRLAATVFVIGLQVGAPLIVAMMAANFSIGLMARSVPQVNVFVVGFPFTIALGLLLLALGIPFFIETVTALHSQLDSILMRTLSGG